MSDIYGKTVTEYALERRVAELERENYLLRRDMPPSMSYEYKPEDPIKMTVAPGTVTLRVVARAEVEHRMGGYNILAKNSDGLGYAYFMDEYMVRQTNKWVRADMLQHVFELTGRALADEVAKNA